MVSFSLALTMIIPWSIYAVKGIAINANINPFIFVITGLIDLLIVMAIFN